MVAFAAQTAAQVDRVVMASKKSLTLSQVLDDVFASSGSEELGESSNMISEDEGDVIFRQPPGLRAVLTDSESELDGESRRNSRRSASFVVVVNQMMLT